MGSSAFLRGCAEVFVEPPVRRAPCLGLRIAQALAEVFPQQGMRVEGAIGLDGEQIDLLQALRDDGPVIRGSGSCPLQTKRLQVSRRR